ncbi:hypothetical protein AVEN_87883-1 [Araneus ventricosus]|uniref:Uncharacterized protein n=1 Tax=Araneus ventricosus TaxID=182803 RepID=A0A4Y2BC04_ARAVE|nr:hypothetical protein AVEN_87883-1 [Araneus ventricosus]
MSRRNHLHDEMRWRAVSMLQAGARQSTVARELNVHLSVTHRLCTKPLPKGSKRADCMKEDCSHDDLFVCLCPQRTLERCCIGPVNIAVGHQSSGTTYSLRMSLDFTPRTIPEEQCYGKSQGHVIGRQTSSKQTGGLLVWERIRWRKLPSLENHTPSHISSSVPVRSRIIISLLSLSFFRHPGQTVAVSQLFASSPFCTRSLLRHEQAMLIEEIKLILQARPSTGVLITPPRLRILCHHFPVATWILSQQHTHYMELSLLLQLQPTKLQIDSSQAKKTPHVILLLSFFSCFIILSILRIFTPVNYPAKV